VQCRRRRRQRTEDREISFSPASQLPAPQLPAPLPVFKCGGYWQFGRLDLDKLPECLAIAVCSLALPFTKVGVGSWLGVAGVAGVSSWRLRPSPLQQWLRSVVPFFGWVNDQLYQTAHWCCYERPSGSLHGY